MRILPVSQYRKTLRLPGDKSITHRAVLLNAMAEGSARVTNALDSADCRSTVDCVRMLGAEVFAEQGALVVRGRGSFLSPAAALDAGNSGTTMRLLTGVLAGRGVGATVIGDKSLSVRPMERVAEPLRMMGADISLESGHAPVVVRPAPLVGIDYRMPVASAQVKSALLLAGLNAEGRTSVTEAVASRDHTERMLAAMGADIRVEGQTVSVRRSALSPVDIDVPSDISACAYFFALGALLGRTVCRDVGVNPTRTGILNVLERMGAKADILDGREAGREPCADIAFSRGRLKATEIDGAEVPSLIDEIPVIAVLAAYAEGTTVIRGARELRYKESDRIRTTAEMIRAMGGAAEELPDGLAIEGRESLPGGRVESYGDHRIAMSAAVGLLASRKGGEIAGAECVNISFPEFFRTLGGAQ